MVIVAASFILSLPVDYMQNVLCPRRAHANYGLLLELALPLNTLRFLLESHDSLALLPVAIPRAIPVNLLAVPAAVAVRLAPLAELAIGAVQRSAANLAALPKIMQVLLEVRNTPYPILIYILLPGPGNQ